MTESIVHIIEVVCGLVIAIRLMAFRKSGCRYRPAASLLAYMMVIASMSIVVYTLFGAQKEASIAGAFLHIVLALAVLMARGNVVDLFRTSHADNTIDNILHGGRHA